MNDPLLIEFLLEKSLIGQPSNHQDDAEGSAKSPDQFVSKRHMVLACPLFMEIAFEIKITEREYASCRLSACNPILIPGARHNP